MQAPFEMSDGLSKLQSLIAAMPPESAHWNEAQNRFHFIDRLLVECLGWEKPDLNVEEPDGAGGRADYVMGTPAKAILEAKREALLWDTLPSGSPKKVRKIKPLLQASNTFSEAVHQVIQYCTSRAAQLRLSAMGLS